MGRYASDTGGTEFKQAPQGNHVARCYSIIDLGTQHGEYQGSPVVRSQVIVRWELPTETEEFDGAQKPLVVSKFYTNSLSEKANLRHDLEAWRSRAFTVEELMKFDLQSIVGKACMVSVVHNEKGRAKVASVAAMPKGMVCPPQFNPTLIFWIDEWDQARFDALPEGFQRIIRESDEYKARFIAAQPAAAKSPASVDPFDDDIPF